MSETRVEDVLGPLNAVGDREGCRVEDGRVKTPTGFKDAWDQAYALGIRSLRATPEHGGAGARSRAPSRRPRFGRGLDHRVKCAPLRGAAHGFGGARPVTVGPSARGS